MELSTEDLARQWAAEGYIIARQLLPGAQVDELNQIAEATLAQWRVCNPETGEPGGTEEATTMRHLNHPEYHRQAAAGRTAILTACAEPQILNVCRALLDDEPLFRCTSLFFNPMANSRDGHWHRDSQFHYADEEEERQTIAAGGDLGNSIQLQIALAPSDDVEVVPGSHLRWDTPEEYEIRRGNEGRDNQRNDMPNALRVDLEPGDAVAFNPLALHRGRYHTDRLRRTLMLTYTGTRHPRFDYFSDQPWFDEPGYLDDLAPSAVDFFQRFIAAYGRDWRTKDRG